MQNIINYLSEKLHLGKNSGQVKYTCHPQNKDELHTILVERLAEDKDAYLNDIDVSKITDMSLLFDDLDPHNIDISEWDVSHVTKMNGMFLDCYKFNSNLSKWNVSKVINMSAMFFGCKNFNCDLSAWDVSNAKYMRYMFNNCESFDCDLSKWNITTEHTDDMFYECTSLKNIPSWYK